MADAKKLLESDKLWQAYPKINDAIDNANSAKTQSDDAVNTASQALSNSESTQTQLDNVLIEGDSSVEAAAARVDTDGDNHPTLKDRLDTEHSAVTAQLADTRQEVNVRKYKHDTAPLVSFLYDDGIDRDYTIIKPIFDSKGVPCSVSLVTDLIGNSGRLTESQLNEMKQAGWSIVSHTASHADLTTLTAGEIEDECKRSQNVLKSLGFDWDILTYPYGGITDTIVKTIRKFYSYGINVFLTDNVGNKPPNFNNMLIERESGLAHGTATLASCKAAVDEAIANGTWLIFEDHASEAEYDSQTTLDELGELIDYIKSQGVEIVNIRDGLDRKANIVDIGERSDEEFIRVGRNGELTGTKGNFSVLVDPNITGNTPLTYFKDACDSSYWIGTNQAAGNFPEDIGGNLVVHRNREFPFGYQMYHIYNSENIYKRNWDTSTETWGEWNNISQSLVSSVLNSHSASTPLDAFPNNRITSFAVNGAGGTGMPNNSAGVCTTYRLGGQPGYGRQEFRSYNSNDLWARHADSVTGNWTAWVKISAV